MTDPLDDLLDDLPLPYSLTLRAFTGVSFQQIDPGQRQPGKINQSVRHHLGPGVYSIEILAFTAGRGFRVTTSAGHTQFPGGDGWQVFNMDLSVNEGEEDYIVVQSGNTGVYTEEQVAAGVRTALNIAYMPLYTP